ncbi:MAG: hypothetical protein [Podoviridae sp. ctviO18]|nr:MAG: hypothetical protein [Podoviridae sp. ctviO18]
MPPTKQQNAYLVERVVGYNIALDKSLEIIAKVKK